MSFAESLKLKVRKRAHFRCCVCRSIGVEIHHILPTEEYGPDTEDNAAPLCPSCHELYGANPTKRKFVREARDFWYEHCLIQGTQTGLTTDDLSEALQSVATKSDIAEVKAQLASLLQQGIIMPEGADHEAFVAVPIERFIRSLYDEDYFDSPDLYDVFFDSRSWYEQDSYDLLDRRALFLKLYGEETARRVCLVAIKSTGFNPDGFTEDDLGKALHAVHVIVILVTLHSKFFRGEDAVECSVLPDGDFVWRRSTKPSKKRRTRKSGARTKAS